MNTIHKYQLDPLPGYYEIQIEWDAEFLKCQMQEGKVTFWFDVMITDIRTPFKIYLAKTGKEIDPQYRNKLKYITTLILPNGENTIHVYKVR